MGPGELGAAERDRQATKPTSSRWRLSRGVTTCLEGRQHRGQSLGFYPLVLQLSGPTRCATSRRSEREVWSPSRTASPVPTPTAHALPRRACGSLAESPPLGRTLTLNPWRSASQAYDSEKLLEPQTRRRRCEPRANVVGSLCAGGSRGPFRGPREGNHAGKLFSKHRWTLSALRLRLILFTVPISSDFEAREEGEGDGTGHSTAAAPHRPGCCERNYSLVLRAVPARPARSPQ